MDGAATAHRTGVVVAVDGPSGAGKSSVSRGVASALRLRYLDTGSMYRALTWWMLEHGVDVRDAGAVAALASKPELDVGTDPAAPTIRVDGMDVAGADQDRPRHRGRVRGVRGARGAGTARPAAARAIGGGGIVVEGRDIGTAVVPDADVKVFLTASEQARAARRRGRAQRRRPGGDARRPGAQ